MPYDGPIPNSPSTPSPSVATGFLTMNRNASSTRGGTSSPGPPQKPVNPSSATVNAGVQRQHMDQYGMATFGFSPTVPTGFAAMEDIFFATTADTSNSVVDPSLTTLQPSGPSYDIGLSYQAQQPDIVRNAGALFQEQPPQLIPAPGPAANQGADRRFTGYGARLDTKTPVAAPAFQNSLLFNTGNVGGQGVNEQQQQQAPNPLHLAFPDEADRAIDPALANWLTGHPASNDQVAAAYAVLARAHPELQSDGRGLWFHGPHDGWCDILHEHRHEDSGGIFFRDIHGYCQSLWQAMDVLLAPWGLAYDIGSNSVQRRHHN